MPQSIPQPQIVLEAIRRRPGMYIGNPDLRGLHVCVFELIANSIEEYMAGRGSIITVTIHADGSLSVKDDGGGISVAPHPVHQLPFVEIVFTAWVASPAYPRSPHRRSGLSGVGPKCVNALSEWMRVSTVWNGMEYRMAFAQGRISEPLTTVAGPTVNRGTTIQFKPDPGIFSAVHFDRDALQIRLDHLAALHPNLEFWLIDERANSANRPLVSRLLYPNGISDFLKTGHSLEVWADLDPIVINGELNDVKVALGFLYSDTGSVSLLSYVNSSPTPRGGTHVAGFLRALADIFGDLAKTRTPAPPVDPRRGLSAFVAIWLAEPRYGGGTKDELINAEVGRVVYELSRDGLRSFAGNSEMMDLAEALILKRD